MYDTRSSKFIRYIREIFIKYFVFQQSFLTGGSDKKIQFWSFELKDEKEMNSKKVIFNVFCKKLHDDNYLDEKTFVI